MDPQSARRLACASHPSDVKDIISKNYIEHHRAVSLLDTDMEQPNKRCCNKDLRGRCRKNISDVALTQYCWKHQKDDSFANPRDSILCHWNHLGLFEKSTS